MHYTKVKPLIEQCGVVWEEGKNIQVGKKELCMFADLLVEAKTHTEPVAWMYERPNGSAKLTFVREPMAGTVVTETPLYTHLAKTLTDEEIAELSDKILCYQIYDNKESGVFEFARAILRKAQEK